MTLNFVSFLLVIDIGKYPENKGWANISRLRKKISLESIISKSLPVHNAINDARINKRFVSMLLGKAIAMTRIIERKKLPFKKSCCTETIEIHVLQYKLLDGDWNTDVKSYRLDDILQHIEHIIRNTCGKSYRLHEILQHIVQQSSSLTLIYFNLNKDTF